MPGPTATSSVLRTVAKRGYAATPAPSSSVVDVEAKTVKSKLKIVSAYSASPVAKISITFKAGPRYELPDELGISHVLRVTSGLSTQHYTPFGITRNLQQLGARLYTTADRENISYTLESNHEQLEKSLGYLANVATLPAFKPWEVQDHTPRVKVENSLLPPEARVFDLLHRAAYRGSLGNSLYCDPSRYGKIKAEHLQNYFADKFTAERAQVTATGVDFAYLKEFALSLDLLQGAGPQAPPSPYHGGELRILNSKEYQVYVAVAGESPGFARKEYPLYVVLKHLYGSQVPVKRGTSSGTVSRALIKTNTLSAAVGFNASAADTGLVGFFFVANSTESQKAYEAAISAFLSAEVTDADFARAKNQAKVEALLNSEYGSALDYFARQIALDEIITPEQFAASIDKVTIEDVKKAAKKVATGKLSVASYGDSVSLPYIENLKK